MLSHPIDTKTEAVPARAGKEHPRARVEALLERYPALSPAELEYLRRWFRREASAFDVAQIASNERLHGRYRAWRRKHIDPFTWKERIVLAVLSAVAVAPLALAIAGEA
jgi:hypothetical protein